MAEYNPSKIIKDGNTYNFRDTTKIPLAGSNAISGDLIPSTDGTVNLGSVSYQWNNAYIKSLTINGVACGDILTHNASEFVNVSSNQTIGGEKDFTSNQKMKGLIINPNASIYKVMYGSTESVICQYGAGTVPESNINPFRFYVGKARNYASAPIVIDTTMHSTGGTSIVLRSASNESGNALDHRFYVGTSVTDNGDGTKTRNAYVQFYNTNEVRPSKNNYCNLGTASLKWADVNTALLNGLNPGALSLPSGTYINVDTTNWDLTCQNELMGSFTPTADGWLMLHVANSGTSEVNFWVIGGVIRINNKSTLNDTNNDNFNMFTIPVEKDVTYNIYGNASEYVAGRSIAYCRFMPCRGNV